MALQETRYEALGIGAVVNSIVYYTAGYLYGTIARTNQEMTAQAAAIYAFANTLLHVLIDLSTGGKDAHPKIFYTALIAGEGLLGAIAILAFRRLQLIGQIGTFICGLGLYARTLYHLHELKKCI